ncbi:MAG: HAMP domain-containing histidine kinase [Ktedonobacterales bacterium]|nr:HAMP domain-containing histidine kinase [Ktedonobacterales bacterium]
MVNLLVVAGILALMAIAVYTWEVHATDQQVNDQLYARAARVMVEEGSAGVGLIPPTTPAPTTGAARREGSDPTSEQYEPTSPDVFMVVVNRAGVVITDPGNVRTLGLPDVAALQPVLSGRQPSTLVTLGDDQHAYRLYTTPIRPRGQIVGALQVGMSLAARHRQLRDLLLILAVVGAGVLVVTAAASFYLAGRALHPMGVAYERQRRFAAAASHELRTPLAILRSEAELVARGLQRLSDTMPPAPGADAPLAPAGAAPDRGNSAASLAEASSATGVRASNERFQVDSDGLAARLGEDVREIVTEVDYMARLVDDLLLLGRDDAALGQFVRRDVDVAAVASEAIAKLEPIARASGVALTMSPIHHQGSGTPAALVVQGDHDRLKQLVLVLLDNAIRYTPAGGAVEVSVRRTHERHLLPPHLPSRGDGVRLTVRDTGIGIAPEDLPHVFDPFYRAKSARTGSGGTMGKTDGAGLGLAMAWWIVTAHNGTIAAASEPGRGATIIVSLPHR